jgi:hypothetical protein
MKSTIRLLSLAYQCHIGYVSIYRVKSGERLADSSGMIYLQPDIIAHRLSNHRGSIPIGDDPGPQSQETAKLTMRDNGQLFDEDLVTRQQQYWTSSPSWIPFFSPVATVSYTIPQTKQHRLT